MNRTEPGQPALRSTLHSKGRRMTPQRQLVLDAIADLEHATPEQICGQVQQTAPTVNISTIYRNLELLEELGVVTHTHIGHGAPTYAVIEHQHVHLVCHRCGRTDEVPTSTMDELSGTLRASVGFELQVNHLALSGHCADCARAEHTAAHQAEEHR